MNVSRGEGIKQDPFGMMVAATHCICSTRKLAHDEDSLLLPGFSAGDDGGRRTGRCHAEPRQTRGARHRNDQPGGSTRHARSPCIRLPVWNSRYSGPGPQSILHRHRFQLWQSRWEPAASASPGLGARPNRVLGEQALRSCLVSSVQC